MKQQYILITIFVLILTCVVCFYQHKVTKQQEQVEDANFDKQAIAVYMLDGALWRFRYRYLCDAIKQEESNPELLKALEKGSNFRHDGSFPWDADIKSLNFSSTSYSTTIHLGDYLGANQKNLEEALSKYFNDLSESHVAISKGDKPDFYILTVTENKDRKKNFQELINRNSNKKNSRD